MIKIPSMIMIGSGHRNVGKTEFACSLIKRFSSDHDIAAIKVTTVAGRETLCPRGGKGCGACTSFEGNYHLEEEHDPGPNKDTCRMLAAGAKKVFWLRVIKSHLKEGLDALQNFTGPNVITICESNSLRLVAEPGLFIIFRSDTDEPFKPSADEVCKYADRIVTFDGKGFDIDLDEIRIIDGRWTVENKK